MRARLLLGASGIALTTLSCAALLGFERLSAEGAPDGTRPDATLVDADGSGGDAGDDPRCGQLGLPDPPTNTAPGNVGALLTALRLLDFGLDVDGGRPSIPGYNLDLRCSTDIASSTCTTKLLPTTFETHARDKTATGVDNAGFSLIEDISRLSDTLSAKGINSGIAEGRYGAVIRIDEWNGQPDDDRVVVEVFPAVGFKKRFGGDAGTGPRFDAKDEWLLDNRFQLGGVLDASSLKADRAWVSGGRLIARFKRIILPMFFPDDPKPFDIEVNDAVLTGFLGSPNVGGKTALSEGVMAGRWKTSDFLRQVRTIYFANSNGLVDTVLCEDVPLAKTIYTAVKSTICDGRDIRSDSADNKGLPCDALSAAARIEAYPIDRVGTYITLPDAGARCVVGSVIPLGDDCSD